MNEKETLVDKFKSENENRKFRRNTSLNVKVNENLEIENGVVKMFGIYVGFLNPEDCLNPNDFNQEQ